MAVSKETLEKHLVQIRRIAEHREAKAEQNIKYYFAALKKDLNSFLGNEYAKLAEDDKLTYAILQQKGEYARFLEEVINKVDGISPKLKNEVQSLIEETYETCYKGLVKGVEGIDDLARLAKEFKAISAISPETVKRAVQNPIKKLTLNSTLERNRKKVIAGIRREISISLTQGDRMSTMARRISKHVEQDYRKSMLIARTEAHRVRESGFNDAAGNVNTILTDNNSEFRMVKTWKTMKDGAVRHTNLANHVEMDGVTILQDEDFELKSGAKASCPGMSGIAAEDCNCRCYLSRHIMNDEEYFKATGKHFSTKAFTSKEKDDIIDNREEEEFIRVETPTSKALESNNIAYNQVTNHTSVLAEDDIITAVAGGDMTAGSCASAALAYAGQKQGWNVLDFRGGDSRVYFAGKINKVKMFNDVGATSIVVDSGKSNLTNGKNILKQLNEGTEYYLSVGRHAAIVRNNGGTMQYLELQSAKPESNGWQDFGDIADTLKHRFGCTTSSRSFSTAYATDISQLTGDDFKTILGYINTIHSKQQKGVSGYVK